MLQDIYAFGSVLPTVNGTKQLQYLYFAGKTVFQSPFMSITVQASLNSATCPKARLSSPIQPMLVVAYSTRSPIKRKSFVCLGRVDCGEARL